MGTKVRQYPQEKADQETLSKTAPNIVRFFRTVTRGDTKNHLIIKTPRN